MPAIGIEDVTRALGRALAEEDATARAAVSAAGAEARVRA
jgi:hypothetical protein